MKQFFHYDAKSGRVLKTPEHPEYGQEEKYHYIMPDTPGYHSPVTGMWVDGKKARERDLKETKSRPWEGIEQEKKEAERIRKYDAEKRDKEVFKQVEQVFKALPEQTRRELGG